MGTKPLMTDINLRKWIVLSVESSGAQISQEIHVQGRRNGSGKVQYEGETLVAFD